jgi:hypothetical protein
MILALLPALLLAVAPAPTFDAIRFFTGATEGTARMKVALGRTRAVRVQGRGRVEPDGTLVLDQVVAREGSPATRRSWRIREDSPGHYTGTLTDAVGPITGETVGNRLRLNYQAKHGVAVEQWLTLADDGRSAANSLTARKLGITVATLEETIRKID